MNIGTQIENINIGFAIESHIKQNNLSLPLPNVFPVSSSNFDPATDFYLEHFNKPIDEFSKTLNEYYIYEKDTYDCKYWTYVWTLYWKANHQKYDWDLQYGMTKNHIFTIVSNETGYCVFDLNMTDCKGAMY
ncbi:MAG: hypothetical protein ACOC5T_05050 [Elusimicrobiota bacterium]